MDRMSNYRQAVRTALIEIAQDVPEIDGIRTEVVVDDSTGHYELLEVGYFGARQRIHGTLIHCDVLDGKVHVEHDGTDAGLADMLIERGVPCEDIVLGFHQPGPRHFTPFATA